MNNSVVEIMIGTRDILSDPARWIKGNLFRLKSGIARIDGYVSKEMRDDIDGVCTVGAIYSTLDREMVISLQGGMAWDAKEPILSIHRFLKQAVLELYGKTIFNIIEWQDSQATTHEMLIAVFNRAIELAQDADDWRIPVMTTTQIEQVAEAVAEGFTPSEENRELVLV